MTTELASPIPPTLRAIVRDAAVLCGRWCLEGTTLAIAEIRADYHSIPDRLPGSYKYLDVTPAELEAILAFPFPALRPTQVNLLYGAFQVECECGEDTPAALTDIHDRPVRCICGREWWIRLVAETNPLVSTTATG
jgi:hypothetical protein